MNEFDKFTSEVGESRVSIYERFSKLMNDMERNLIKPIPIAVNTKFLNSLQPEWRKYIINLCLSRNLHSDDYGLLNQAIVQDDGVDIQSKNVGNSGRYMKRTTNNQGDAAGNVNVQRNTGNATNVHRIPRTTTNSWNGLNIQCYNCNAKGYCARYYPKPRVHDLKYFVTPSKYRSEKVICDNR
ncbi:hypothetical protein Tco_1355317 [Tanacetum coccineum]